MVKLTVVKLNELCYYLLDFSSYGEPLYILMGAALRGKIATKPEEIADCLIWLHKKGYIKVKLPSLFQDAKFVPVENLQLQNFIEYIERNRDSGFNDYPGEGEEYLIETTELGEEQIPDDYEFPD